MAGPQPSFRLYIIGRIDEDLGEQILTTLAEYRTARGLARTKIKKVNFESLLTQIRGLKSFIEAGAPEFERDTLKELGRQLLDILLTGRTRDLFFKATGERAEGAMLPLEIVAEDPVVAGWPWEYLYDSGSESFVSQEFYPISRSIFTATKPSVCGPINGKIRLLIILGVPPDDPHTTPKEEIKYIKEVFSTHLDDDRLEIEILNPDNYRNLLIKLSTVRYDIVHYFGHAGFDYKNRQGYLSISQPGKEKFKIEANTFAQVLGERGIRLVFLNACKTAVGDPLENPARSSIAAALLDRGIPAVVASQFSLPDNSAHFLASTIYNTLLTGKPVGDAIRDGRQAMAFDESAKFFDWGIPVLYSTDPSQIILPSSGRKPKWSRRYSKAAKEGNLLEELAGNNRGAPSLVAERTRSREGQAKCRVALIDVDSKVGFLPELAEAANRAQSYYGFEVAYLPVPSGYARDDLVPHTLQTYLPRLTPVLGSTPRTFSVDYVCCLTRNMIATEEDGGLQFNLFAAGVPGTENVLAVSTFGLRDYARQADVPFAKAVLVLCLSMLVWSDPRWDIEYHPETVGCPFDYCNNRDDIVVGLRKMRFDHMKCRDKVGDPDQLGAIDALAALEVDSTS